MFDAHYYETEYVRYTYRAHSIRGPENHKWVPLRYKPLTLPARKTCCVPLSRSHPFVEDAAAYETRRVITASLKPFMMFYAGQ